MALRERAAWISAITTLAVWGYYFSLLVGDFLAHRVGDDLFVGTFIGCVILSVVVQVAIHIAVALLAPKEVEVPIDERERLIELKATHVAYHLMAVGVVIVALASPMVAAGTLEFFRPDMATASATLLMGNGVILCIVLSEVVKCAVVVSQYRRDAMV